VIVNIHVKCMCDAGFQFFISLNLTANILRQCRNTITGCFPDISQD